MGCCEFHEAFPDVSMPCMVRVASATIHVPTHDEHAAKLLKLGLITAACRETPCLPCDGRAEAEACICSCHRKEGA